MIGRRLALLAAAVPVLAAVSGCNVEGLTKRELVVDFLPSATDAQRAAVLEACGHVTPDASPEPFQTTGPAANRVGNVRFRIDHANDREIARLETCLSQQPGVRGDHIPDVIN
jgi:hypothetical protein